MTFDEYSKNDNAQDGNRQKESSLRKDTGIILHTDSANMPYKEESASMTLSMLQQNLGSCLQIIDDEVMHGYITRLHQLPIIEADRNRIDSLKDIHFFRISELVYQENESVLYKLAAVFGSLSSKRCTLVLMIKSDGNQNDFYLGVRSLDERYSSGTMMQMLQYSLLGMFPGSHIDKYYDDELKKDMKQLCIGSISSVTCVADYKQETDDVDNRQFVQGLDKFIDSMRGKSYMALLIADNLEYMDLAYKKGELENIYTQISPFANMQFNFTSSNTEGISDGKSMGTAENISYGINSGINTSVMMGKTHTRGTNESYGVTDTEGTSESTANGVTDTKGYSDGTSDSVSNAHTDGTFHSAGVGGNGIFKKIGINYSRGASHSDTRTITHGTSHTDSVSKSISKTLSHGISDSHSDSSSYGSSESDSNSESYTVGIQSGESYNTGETFSFIDSQTLSETFGTSQGTTLCAQNMTLISILKKIEAHLKRIETCESFGMWNFAAYFLAESAAESETAANIYRSVVSGEQSGIERAAVNTWIEQAEIDNLSMYLKNFLHPRFCYDRYGYDKESVIVEATAMVSTNELAIHMGLPRCSVKGLSVIEHAPFAQEVIQYDRISEKQIYLGKVYHLGGVMKTDVELDVDSLTMHTFITGSTGTGKSTVIYSMLDKLIEQDVKFMVIEPAKGEYKDRFGSYENVSIYGTNYKKMSLLRINPFSFPDDIHVLEHIDRLIEIFNVCWPMYAAMPAVLKDAMERAYIAAGWNLATSECRYKNREKKPLFPSFIDVLGQINVVMEESAYSTDSKGDYKGALCTRLKSLTNGLYGQIFSNDELTSKELFDRNVIIDLSRTGSSETKALIMGLLVMKLQEYRMSTAEGGNKPLKHITVLEEAHNILKRTSTVQSNESSNVLGKSVEMLANSIAEMRTYGEGFIIADQAPGLLDMAVIRNTNTKIILRLPDLNDRELVGRAAGLNDDQIIELSRLKTFVAVVYQNNWLEPVLCNIDTNFKNLPLFHYEEKGMMGKDKNRLVEFMLQPVIDMRKKLEQSHIDNLINDVYELPIAAEIKVAFMKYLTATEKKEVQRLREKILYHLFNTEIAFELAKEKESDIKSWYNYMKEVLEPDITFLSENDQYKIILILTKAWGEVMKDRASRALFTELTKYSK